MSAFILTIRLEGLSGEIYWTKYSRMDQVKFVETAFKKFEEIWSVSLQIF